MFLSRNFSLKFAIILSCFLASATVIQAKWLTLHNDFFMYDLDGNKINTRSGAMRKFGDTYYWYGSANRFTDQTCYSSKDLLHWTYEGVALEAPSTNRVDVIYNEDTEQYVMFLKTGASDGAELGIATSDAPEGPFTLIDNYKVYGYNIGDMSVYQDTDGQAYLAYVWDSIPGANSGGISQHALSRLSSDYLSVGERIHLWDRGQREANLVMKGNGLYYYLTSLTLWTESTATQYYTAPSIDGPWTDRLIPVMVPGNTANNSWDTQCDFVFNFNGPQDTVRMYVGDRWEKPDPARLGDYVFLPVSFTPNDSLVLNYYQDWEVDPDAGIWRPIEEERNLALNKTVTASSSLGSMGEDVIVSSKTWRNYMNGKWTSSNSDEEWIQVDLGSEMEFNRVILKWDSSYAQSFKIQVSSDESEWADVFSTSAGGARSITDETFEKTNARYVRMQGVERGTNSGYSLYQFMVLNDSVDIVSNKKPYVGKVNGNQLLAQNGKWLSFNLDKGRFVKLEILDSKGKIKTTLHAGYKHSGFHQIKLPHYLSSGHYLARLKIGASTASTINIQL